MEACETKNRYVVDALEKRDDLSVMDRAGGALVLGDMDKFRALVDKLESTGPLVKDNFSSFIELAFVYTKGFTGTQMKKFLEWLQSRDYFYLLQIFRTSTCTILTNEVKHFC